MLRQVVKYRPNDKDAKAKYTECNKIVKQQAFERAIRVEDTKKSIADALDIENMGKFMDSHRWPPDQSFQMYVNIR